VCEAAAPGVLLSGSCRPAGPARGRRTSIARNPRRCWPESRSASRWNVWLDGRRHPPVRLLFFDLAIASPSGDSLRMSATSSSTAKLSEHTDQTQGMTGRPVWDRLESQITWYETRARTSQWWFKLLKVVQIVVAAAIPVVAAAGASATVAGAMGAAVVVLRGSSSYFSSNRTGRATARQARR
jgi:hypothetical protein